MEALNRFFGQIFKYKPKNGVIELRVRMENRKTICMHFQSTDSLIETLQEIKDTYEQFHSDFWYTPNVINISIEEKKCCKNEDIIGSNVLFCDIDFPQYPIPPVDEILQKLPIKPSIVVFSGQKGYHCYWILNKFIDVEKWKQLQSGWIAYLRTIIPNIDPVVKNPARVMRAPGCKHPKSGKECVVIREFNIEYPPEDFEKYQDYGKERIILQEGNIPEDKIDTIGVRLGELLRSVWVVGYRHYLSLYLSGLLRKKGYSLDQTKKIIEKVCSINNDEEVNDRLRTVEDSFKKQEEEITGFSGLEDIIRKILTEKQYSEREIDIKVAEILEALQKNIGYFKEKTVMTRISTTEYFVNSPVFGIYKRVLKKDGEHWINVHAGHLSEVIIIRNPNLRTEEYIVTMNINKNTVELQGNVKDIVELLRQRSGIKSLRHLENAISSLINEFENRGYAKIEIRPISGFGFYLDEDGNIQSCNVYEELSLNENTSIEDLKNGLHTMVKLIETYCNRGNLKEKVWNAIYYHIIAPFAFVRKQNKKICPILTIVGPSGTAKTFANELGGRIWNAYFHPDCNISGTTISYPARLGYAMLKSTFPIYAEEGGKFLYKLQNPEDELSEMIKLIAENILDARSHAKKKFPPQRTIIVTANYDLPKIADSLRYRIYYIKTDPEERHSVEERQKINKMMKELGKDLTNIGSFITANCNDFKEYLFEEEMIVGGYKILKKLFEIAGYNYELPLPSVSYFEEDLEERMSDWEMCLHSIRKDLLDMMRESGIKVTSNFSSVFLDLIGKGLTLPYLYIGKNKEFVLISQDVLKSVRRHFGYTIEIGSLKDIAISNHFLYDSRKVPDSSGNYISKKGIILDFDFFLKLLDREIVEKDSEKKKLSREELAIAVRNVLELLGEGDFEDIKNKLSEICEKQNTYFEEKDLLIVIDSLMKECVIFQPKSGIYKLV